ncbi:hypothetical protein K7X08_011182 [Anisodus acutangulus]|uniref:ABC-2 type transporter transmembrane domain-containing protein n=1 Tax=Anisodus acutangulus TaxID=402998 RepID=A0A9Q1RAW4_9SOLA|nr:hypothetical protein K7X08_011182 [Anisodus acutangulus]
MDEPTSGVDVRAAAIVTRTVRNTVDTGRTVACTIHQPSIDIFDAFNEGNDGVPKIKDSYNPATWMLEITTAAQEALLGIDYAELYNNSELHKRNKALIKELSVPAPGSKDLYFPTKYSQSFFTQCIACLSKQHWGRQQDFFNAIGAMYAAVMFLGVQNSTAVQPIISIERTVFYRERAAGMYSALPYAFGQVMIELPYLLIQTMIYGVIVMMTVAATPNLGLATIISSAFMDIGIFSQDLSLQKHMDTMEYGLMASQFGDLKDKLDTNETVEQFIESYFDFKYDFVGYVALIHVGFYVVLGFVFAYSIKVFNFQKR